MSKYSHLWNDLPIEVRKRLMPCLIESQILHLRQARELIVHHHAEELRELDSWIKNCERSLEQEVAASDSSGVRASTASSPGGSTPAQRLPE
jgi:hypothetical protein